MNAPVTLKQLRYLVAVADQRHFGRAAAACHISQPSLSAQIQQLEELLGVQLFERSRRQVLPTPAGTAAVERARRVLAEVDDLVAAARHGAAPLSGDFRLGVIPTLGPYLLPRIMPALRTAYPELRLYLREDLTERLLEQLDRGTLEAALLALPIGHAGLAETPLFDEPFLLAVPAEHRLAARAAVDLPDLAGEWVLLLEDGHCFREQALAVCRLAGMLEAGRFAATSLETLREMVASRIGVTLLPALACNGATSAEAAETIVLRPFAAPPPVRRIGLVWRDRAARAAEVALLAAFLRRHLPAGAVTPLPLAA